MGDGQSPIGSSLSEGHVLVRAKESHQLSGSVNSDRSGSVDVEVAPCLIEVGVEVGLDSGGLHLLVGGEDLGGGSSGSWLIHNENTGWDSFLIGDLNGVGVKHGSHEEIVGISSESSWDDSIVSGSWSEIISSVSGSLEVLIIGRGGRRGGGLNLDVGSHWWSSVGSFGRGITVLLLEDSLVSVLEDGSEFPGFGGVLSGFLIELNMGSHWWSSVSSGGGFITILLLEDSLVSVLENGSEFPGFGSVFSGDKSYKGSESKVFHC